MRIKRHIHGTHFNIHEGGQGVSFYPPPPPPTPKPLYPSSPHRKRKISSFSLLPFLSIFSHFPPPLFPLPSSPSSRTLTYPLPPPHLPPPSYPVRPLIHAAEILFTCFLFHYWLHKAEIIFDAYLCTCILHRKSIFRHLMILLSFVLMQQKKLCSRIIS